jgi:hypothetical protein
VARRQVEGRLPAVLGDSPGAGHGLAEQPREQARGGAVDEEEVGDLELAEVGEDLVLPEALNHPGLTAVQLARPGVEFTGMSPLAASVRRRLGLGSGQARMHVSLSSN